MMPSNLSTYENEAKRRPTSLRLKKEDASNYLNPSQGIESEELFKEEPILEKRSISSLKPKTLKLKEEDFPLEGENDLDREIERNIARGTSRILETTLGLPGDLYSFAKGLFGGNPETNLPTSQSLKEFSEKASRGYTKPKTEFEEKGDEVIQDIASFMTPGSGKYNLVRNIGIPVVANLVKEGMKLAGSDKKADAAKIGSMVVLDLMNLKRGGAKKFAGNLFNESEKLIPEGATLKSSSLEKGLSSLKKSLESGGSAPSTEKALKKVNEIQSKINKGEIEVKELIDFRKNINELKSELGGFEIQLPKSIKRKAIANLDNVKSEVIKSLDQYGTTQNPKFGKLNSSANEAWAAYETSDKLGSAIKKSLTAKMPLVKTLFGLGSVGGAAMFPAIATKLGVGAAIGLPVYEGYKILHQVMKSPTLRKYYGNILKGAASGNSSQIIKNSKALEKGLEEENQ